jgi:hypothetical protein
MPPLTWTTGDPIELVQLFEARHTAPQYQASIAGALFVWAVWAVESLRYLDDIDLAYASNPPIASLQRDIIDVAHARWATSTSITALDLCAAGLGRAFCQQHGIHELDLADFCPASGGKLCQRARRKRRRKQLPDLARKWIDAACRDPRYKTIKEARNWLTHSRGFRHLSVGEAPQRIELELGKTIIGVRQLIELAPDFAKHQVSAFLQLLPRL